MKEEPARVAEKLRFADIDNVAQAGWTRKSPVIFWDFRQRAEIKNWLMSFYFFNVN